MKKTKNELLSKTVTVRFKIPEFEAINKIVMETLKEYAGYTPRNYVRTTIIKDLKKRGLLKNRT